METLGNLCMTCDSIVNNRSSVLSSVLPFHWASSELPLQSPMRSNMFLSFPTLRTRSAAQLVFETGHAWLMLGTLQRRFSSCLNIVFSLLPKVDVPFVDN
jgi:hypothetical protein